MSQARGPRPARSSVSGKRSSRKVSTNASRSTARSSRRVERAGRRDSDVASDRVYVADSDIHGLGMFAQRRLRADVVLGRLMGMPTYDDGTYVLWITDELGLELCNDFRFINHSSTPNCALSDVDVVTLRPIAKDEELTHDYGW